MKKISLFLFLSICITGFSQRSYKQMMHDPSVNFYTVCEVAEAYFETIDKTQKGSGWKGYQRWKYQNESKFYPSGDRSNVDPYFVQKQFEAFASTKPGAPVKAIFSPTGWEEVGPVTIETITGHYAPGLGRIETFYVDPVEEEIMYIGSRSGGFWKSIDGGTTWTGGSTDFLVASGVNSIGVSPTNPDSILINVRNAGNGTTHGIYRSIDAGETWTETNYNPVELGKGGLGSNFRVNRVVYHPRVGDLIFVCASDGLYRSDDNLDTWVKVTNGSISDIEFHPTDNDIVYIYDYYYWGDNKNKVLRSTDGGVSFTGSAEIPGNDNNTSVQLDVTPLCEDCIYFASGNGIWKSFDAGLTFEFVSSPDGGSQGFAVGDLDSTKMIYGYIDCFASANGGLTFDQRTWWSLGSVDFDGDQYIHADLREAECINGIFYVATDGYFAKSEDHGLTWERLNDNTGLRENYTLGVSQSNHYRTMVGSQDNGTSIRQQDEWIEFWGADGMEAIIHPLNDDWMIGSNQYGGRRRTFNGGLTQDGASPSGHTSGWVAPLAYAPNDHMTVYHFGENVYRSEAFGSGYTLMGTPSFSGTISEAAIAENNSDMLVVSRWENIELSLDGGATFEDIQGTLPDYTITDIAFDPLDDNTFVVTYNRHQNDGSKVFITHDMGETWTNITANLNDMPIRGAVIDHTSDKNIYLAAEIGVFVKGMDDTDWELYNTNLPNCMVYELEIVNGSNTLRAATWGRGVWEYNLKDRQDFPVILKTRITDQPTFTTPQEGEDQFVTSQINYDGELSSVFVKWSVEAPTFENTIEMENVSDSTWVSVDPMGGEYPCGTNVYFKVYAVGEASDTTETYKFMYTIQHGNEYCESSGNLSWQTSITRINFGDINNTSGKTVGYTDYGCLGFETEVERMSDYDLTMHMNTDGDYTIHGKAWIDWNQNGDFTDVGEEYDLGTAVDTEDGPSTLSPLTITVPESAILGETTMRTAVKFANDPTPCEVGFDGEVEDYKITVGCTTIPGEITESVCEPYVSPSGLFTWATSGVYSDTLISVAGCDSVVTVNLTIFEPSSSDVSVTNCGTYVSPSGLYTWTTSGVYEDTLISSTGCDSTLTVDLTIVEATTSGISVTACDSYTSPSGDFTWDVSGTYTDVIPNIAGCDSTITIDLDIENVNTMITLEELTLTAVESESTYQWLDCDSDWEAIDGATSQSYTVTENGNYAVIVTSDECSDTSDCYTVTTVSIDEQAENNIALYPNPSNGSATLLLNGNSNYEFLKVYDVAGRIVYQEAIKQRSEIQLALNVSKGIYYLVLDDEHTNEIMLKLVIE